MSATLSKAVTVKIVSDIVWPYCYVGLRHLEAASQASGVQVNLEWLPFMLNPNMSEEGEDLGEHLMKKYGPSIATKLHDPNFPLTVAGRKVGIEFKNDRLIVNTKRAHALMEHLKEKNGNETANKFMVDLYKTYFEQRGNINDKNLLSNLVGKYGVDAEEAALAMAEHNLIGIAKQDRQIKSQYRVNGVPFFMIHPNDGGRPIGFSGAQPSDIIAEQLEAAADS